MDMSWRTDWLACTFARLDYARLLPVGSHEELHLRDLCRIGERPAGVGYGSADVALPGIRDRVYQNMVRRYRVCVEVAGRHNEPFL